MKQKALLLMLLGGLCLLTICVQTIEAKNRGAFSFYLENDIFAGTDRYYTHGMKLTWISPDRVSGQFDPKAQSAFSISFSQNIYTPVDITREDLIKDDRPYAGVSYFSLALHRKRDQSMDTLGFLLGIVGPSSYAAEVQRFIHSLYRGTDPKGWHHQLRDEIVFGVVFGRIWRVMRSPEERSFGFDLIGQLGGSLGNLMTAAAAGGQFRVGWNLPLDFGTFLIQPGGESSTFFDEQASHRYAGRRFGIHTFLCITAQAVCRNIFLDGNTFRDSHRVDKIPFGADIVTGLVFTYGRFKFSYAYVFRTKQFETQAKPQVFGAINISLAY